MKTTRTVAIAVLLLAYLTGCSQPMAAPSPIQVGASDQARVQVTWAPGQTPSDQTRAVLGGNVAKIVLTASRSGMADVVKEMAWDAASSRYSSVVPGLSPGSWTFRAEAQNAAGKVLYLAATQADLAAGLNQISLFATLSGGFAKVQAALPFAGGFDTLVVTLKAAGFADVTESLPVDPAATSVTGYVFSIPVGTWALTASGRQGGVESFSGLADVVVVDNAQTDVSLTLTQTSVTPVRVSAGLYGYNQTITLTADSATPLSVIRYTSDGTLPTATSTLFPGAGLTLGPASGVKTYQFIAFKTGASPSPVLSKKIGPQAPGASLSVPAGTYNDIQTVTVTVPADYSGSTMTYTLDGTAPTSTSPVYSAPLLLQTAKTLKVLVSKTGFEPSLIQADYQITSLDFLSTTALTGVQALTVSLPSGAFLGPQTVTIGQPFGASCTLRYTLDGSSPLAASPVYISPLTVSTDTDLRIRAFFADGTWSNSVTYSFRFAPGAVSASGGIFTPSTRVIWNSVTGATSYNLYWSTIAGVTPQNGTKISGVTSPYSHTGLTAATTYYYVVTAVNGSGESSASAQTSTASIQGLGTSSVMKTVAGGTFNNGTSAVTVSSFQMASTEVTQAQYFAVNGTNPSAFTGDTTRPVEKATWYDAVEFCNRLSAKEGLTPVYTLTGRTPASGNPITVATVTQDLTKTGYRLPTEAEWEWAARGGTQTLGFTYAGSNVIGDVAWYSVNGGNTTHPVATKTANELGLYDMNGNVWEWCWDYFGSYSATTQIDPTGPASSTTRVVRGGSQSAVATTTAFHGNGDPTVQGNNVGFRVVRTSPVAVLGLTFTLGTLQNLTFTPSTASVAVESSLILSPGDTTLASGGTHWRWYFDGSLDAAQTGNSFTLDTHGMLPGSSSINVLVDYQGLQYSGSINITVKG